MSRAYDRALDVLAGHDTQRSDEPRVSWPISEHRCWRCAGADVNEIGLCEPCAAWMRGDTDDDPAGYPYDITEPDPVFIADLDRHIREAEEQSLVIRVEPRDWVEVADPIGGGIVGWTITYAYTFHPDGTVTSLIEDDE